MEVNIVIAAVLIVRGDLGSTRVERHSVSCFQIPLLLLGEVRSSAAMELRAMNTSVLQ
jgi:hypothetical protein